jgi:hypothetical protein
MVIVVEKIREGFETMKTELDEMKVNIDAEKEIEREAFEKALEEKYADRNARIEGILAQIVYTEEVEDKSAALKREHAIKKLPRTEKLKLIDV